MAQPPSARSWQVLLLGGASGNSRTSISYRIARTFAVGLTEVDDFQVLLETMTTPEQQPVLHYWRTHPDPTSLPVEQIVALQIAVGRAMSAGILAVVRYHLENNRPIILEGDYLLPELLDHPVLQTAACAGTVQAIFIIEEDRNQLAANLLAHDSKSGSPHSRAMVSALYNQWLKAEALQRGIQIVSARPWTTSFERVLAALQTRSI